MPVINAHAGVSSWTRCLNFGLSLYLSPYFVYVINEGSGKSAQMRRLACTLLLTDAITTKISYTGPYVWVKVFRVNPEFRILRLA